MSATILLVDDEPAVRLAVRRTLEREGYAVLEAAGGAEAAAMLEARNGGIGLLLTDVVMPGMDGRELVAWARARHPRLRVLYMSGYVPAAGGGIGAPVLAKPFSRETLLRTVREVLAAP